MKNLAASIMALVAGLSIAGPTLAQQTYERGSGESAMQMASRIGACDESGGISVAEFTEGGSVLRVTCLGGTGFNDMSGGLGTGTAVAGGAAAAALVAYAIDSSSSSTTTTN